MRLYLQLSYMYVTVSVEYMYLYKYHICTSTYLLTHIYLYINKYMSISDVDCGWCFPSNQRWLDLHDGD